MSIKRRLAELEAKATGGERLHVVRLWKGQTEDEALARHEAEQGPINRDSGLIVFVRKFITEAEYAGA